MEGVAFSARGLCCCLGSSLGGGCSSPDQDGFERSATSTSVAVVPLLLPHGVRSGSDSGARVAPRPKSLVGAYPPAPSLFLLFLLLTFCPSFRRGYCEIKTLSWSCLGERRREGVVTKGQQADYCVVQRRRDGRGYGGRVAVTPASTEGQDGPCHCCRLSPLILLFHVVWYSSYRSPPSNTIPPTDTALEPPPPPLSLVNIRIRNILAP